ncbi:hypothetical protein [uncultured Oscillibacter sp.]|jgi:hypothetical protein|uniref:hypothetical protein n=1 Tax=uncultured Oscillibacter sp. TaxID=876091 RepID=UPI0026135CE8|nr:hypothetical protein [uncultured Oscillibacter sp.]
MSRKLSGLAVLTLALCLLTGCSALLERTYSTAEPHSSKFWESEAAGTLRAENHQDVVNDLLLLVGRHQETATLRLYEFKSDLAVADTLEEAAAEVQQETPMGAYAVEFITTSSHAQRGYYEVAVRIGYRRTLEQLQAVVNATSPEALYSLLAAALDEGKTELAVRMGYWGENGGVRVEEAMAQLREERELTETVPWVVNYYPAGENPGLVEFLLDPPEPEEETPGEAGEAFGEDGEALAGEAGEGSPEEGGDPDGGEAPEDGEAPKEDPERKAEGEEKADPAAPAETGEEE